MVMMVMMTLMGVLFNVAMLLVAVLTLGFKLKRRVGDSVLVQLFSDPVFDFVWVAVCDYMHRRVAQVSVNAADVYMMNVKHTAELCEMLL